MKGLHSSSVLPAGDIEIPAYCRSLTTVVGSTDDRCCSRRSIAARSVVDGNKPSTIVGDRQYFPSDNHSLSPPTFFKK